MPDVLDHNLRVVFCGTAAGDRSAELKMYYAGQGNKFWKVLHDVGFTTQQLAPHQFRELLMYGIGLTDLVKMSSGRDNQIDFRQKGVEVLKHKIETYTPQVLCFNGKRAAEEFLSRSVTYGLQRETVGRTKLFVAPSTSGAASGYWNVAYWFELAKIAGMSV